MEDTTSAPPTQGKAQSKYLDPQYKGEQTPEYLRDGPVANRKCTDFLCCIIFSCFLAAWVICGLYGFANGNPIDLTYPYDYSGNQCGAPGDDAQNYPYIFFPFPMIGYLDFTVCVKECPDSYSDQPECFFNEIFTEDDNCEFRWEQVFQGGVGHQLYGKIQGLYPTDGFLGRICLPSTDQTKDWALDALDSINDVIDLNTISEWIGDVWTANLALLMVAGLTILIATVYFIFLRFCLGVIVWLSILIVFVVLLLLGAFFHISSENQYEDNSDDDTKNTLFYLAIIFYSLSGLFLLYILCMCNRIRLAIAIMKTGTTYLKDVWYSLLVPPCFFILILGIYAYWMFACVYLYSSGDISQQDHDLWAEVDKETNQKYAFYFEFWGILWMNAFLIGYGQFILAGSVCIWYFSYGAESGPQRPVSRPIWWGLRYHLGSLAFGSLILAIVWTIKYTLEYMKQKIKDTVGDEISTIMKIVLKCLSCYILCFERFIKFLNKNAYIQIALNSTSFCIAAKDAFFLILRNAARFLALGSIGNVFMFLGKFVIALTATYCGYLIVTRAPMYEDELHSPIFPCIVFFLIGYVIASLFMAVYSMAIDTILQCFLADEELNEKYSRPPEHSPPQLRQFLDHERGKKQSKCC